MKQYKLLTGVLSVFLITLCSISSYAQFGNTISGYVFGLQRQPVSDATVELFDDYSRSVGRTRTNAAGRYIFGRISSGRYRIRVLSLGLDYEEQEQEVEIQNINSSNGSGGITTSGYDNVQRDFYLRQRKNAQQLGNSESIFVQEIPAKAREVYKKAIESLNNANEEEEIKNLKLAIELFPDYYDALELLGREYVKTQHFVPAQILLQRATQINPRGYKSWYGLAYSLYSQNKTNEAIQAVQKANSLNQSSVESLLLAGVLLRKAERYEEAEKSLKKAKEFSKGSIAEVHWQLALLYGNNLKRYREAADELEMFLKTNSNSKDAENIKKLIKEFRDKSKN